MREASVLARVPDRTAAPLCQRPRSLTALAAPLEAAGGPVPPISLRHTRSTPMTERIIQSVVTEEKATLPRQ